VAMIRKRVQRDSLLPPGTRTGDRLCQPSTKYSRVSACEVKPIIYMRAQKRQVSPSQRVGGCLGSRFWREKAIREYLKEDVYKPHTHEEIIAMVEAGQMSASVAAGLDEAKCYGIWWFNRRRTKTMQVAKSTKNGERTYTKKTSCVERPKEEWIAVPVPDSGIRREWVDAAREAIKDNTQISTAGHRVWELSGGTTCCATCGWNIMVHSVTAPRLAGQGDSATTAAASTTRTARRAALTRSATGQRRWRGACEILSPPCSKTLIACGPGSKR
jgi:hypothetical protein